MKSFTLDIDTLLTVAAAVLDVDGVLLEANAGFLRLLPSGASTIAAPRVARFFAQPTFASLVALPESGDTCSYAGLMTIGDYEGKSRTMRGRVWRAAARIRILAEYDVVELERLNERMLELNQEGATALQRLARANISLKQREGVIVESSLTDALTGVGNRRKLEQALAIEISRVRRNEGTLGAIMVDIDHFKCVNDEHGHAVGDKVLTRVAAFLRSQFRQYDVVTRFGGEEFVVLLPHATLDQVTGKAERFRRALETDLIEPLERPVTASFGVAELHREEDAESFLQRIDRALYLAKVNGRNRVVADC